MMEPDQLASIELTARAALAISIAGLFPALGQPTHPAGELIPTGERLRR